MGNYVSTDSNAIIVTKEGVGSDDVTNISETIVNVQPVVIDEDIVLVSKEKGCDVHTNDENDKNDDGCDDVTHHKKFVSRVSVFMNEKVKPKFKEFKEKMSRRKHARNVSPVVAQKIAEQTEDKNTYRVFTVRGQYNNVPSFQDGYRCIKFNMEDIVKVTLTQHKERYYSPSITPSGVNGITNFVACVKNGPFFSHSQNYCTCKKGSSSVVKSGFISTLKQYESEVEGFGNKRIITTAYSLPILGNRFHIVITFDFCGYMGLYDSNNSKMVVFPRELRGKYALFDDGTILSLDENCSHDLKFSDSNYCDTFNFPEYPYVISEENVTGKTENTHGETSNKEKSDEVVGDNVAEEENNDDEMEKSFQIHSDDEDDKNDKNENDGKCEVIESNLSDGFVEISKCI